MIRISVLCLFLFSVAVPAFAAIENTPSISPPTQAAEKGQDTLVRVRTHQHQTKISVAGFGLKLNGQKVAGSTIPKRQRLNVRFANGRWHVGTPINKIFRERELTIEGDFLQVNNIPVADHLILVPVNKKFDVIAELGLEDYLKGVLPSEMPMQWPLETLKAQVVASRSYALSQIQAHENDDFHLDDSVMHQVFSWANYLNANPAEQNKILQALNETRGEVLRDTDGSAYTAYFHSDCGGHTEEPNAVWGNGKKNGTVRDEHCALNTKSAWQEAIARAEFDKTLADYLKLAPESHVTSLETGARSPSGRVQNLLVAFNDDSRKFKISGQMLRQIFGFSRIKSTNFEFELTATSISFSGRGKGHGVGLCQQGARFMALAGADHRAILHRYYPRARL